MAVGRDEQRDRIARLLAQRQAGPTPGGIGDNPGLRPLFGTPPGQPMSLPEYQRLYRQRVEEQRSEGESKPEYMLNYDQMLYAPQWMPADQPNDLRGDTGYHWKLQL